MRNVNDGMQPERQEPSAYPCQCEPNINLPYLTYASGVCLRRGKLLAAHFKQLPAATTTTATATANKSCSPAQHTSKHITLRHCKKVASGALGHRLCAAQDTETESVARSWANVATLKRTCPNTKAATKRRQRKKTRVLRARDRLKNTLPCDLTIDPIDYR